jgi:hypothetical protein
MEPIYIKQSELQKNLLGFLELSADEQLAKQIYEATGDVAFKGFLPLTWHTDLIVKMRNALDQINAAGITPDVLQMQMRVPEVSAAADDFFLRNNAKVTGLLPSPQQAIADVKGFLTPVLWIAGLAAAAFLLSQAKHFIPKKKENKV